MKLLLHTVLVLILCSLCLSSCSKERRTAKRIDGFWTINSYVITQDSTLEEIEMLGLLFSKGNIDFNAYDLSNSIGDFEISMTDIISDSIIVTAGLWSLDELGEELTLTIQEAENITDVTVSKEKIVIEGIVDSAMARIEGVRF